MKQTVRAYVRYLPSIAVMALIFALSSRTSGELNTVLPWFQKLFPAMCNFDWGHFAAYFVLALTYAYGFGIGAERLPIKAIIVLLCLFYGLTDEYHQSFVAGRTPDVADLRHDGLGAALAMVLIAVPPLRTWWRRLAA